MLDIYGVTFFDHRRIERVREIEEKVFELICEILRTHQYVEFFIGRDGEFDLLMASVIRKAKKHVGNENSSMIWRYPGSERRSHRWNTVRTPERWHPDDDRVHRFQFDDTSHPPHR